MPLSIVNCTASVNGLLPASYLSMYPVNLKYLLSLQIRHFSCDKSTTWWFRQCLSTTWWFRQYLSTTWWFRQFLSATWWFRQCLSQHVDSVNVYQQHDDSINVFQQNDDSVNVYQQHDDSVNVYQQHDYYVNVCQQHDDSVNVYQQHDDSVNIYCLSLSYSRVLNKHARTNLFFRDPRVSWWKTDSYNMYETNKISFAKADFPFSFFRYWKVLYVRVYY